MYKNKCISLIKKFGDAILTMRDEHIMCTMDFTTPYIKDAGNTPRIKPGFILVWSWTDNQYRHIYPRIINRISALQDLLDNKGTEENGTEN